MNKSFLIVKIHCPRCGDYADTRSSYNQMSNSVCKRCFKSLQPHEWTVVGDRIFAESSEQALKLAGVN